MDDDGDMVIDCLDKCPDDIVNDPDNEGIGAAVDNCPAVSNATQADGDYDGMGDACRLEICDGICDKIDACADDPNNDIYGGGLCAQTEEGGAVRSAMSLRRVTPCRSITTSTWRLETLVAERRRGRKRARAAASARRTHARQTAAGADRWRP